MNGHDFIAVASRLILIATPSEADLRTAASRAYYGAFHLALAFLNEDCRFFCRVRENTHIWVQTHFQECSMIEAKEVGDLLANLHTERKKADYNLDKPAAGTKAFATLCVHRADQIRTLLGVCRNNQAIVIQEMSAYRSRLNMS